MKLVHNCTKTNFRCLLSSDEHCEKLTDYNDYTCKISWNENNGFIDRYSADVTRNGLFKKAFLLAKEDNIVNPTFYGFEIETEIPKIEQVTQEYINNLVPLHGLQQQFAKHWKSFMSNWGMIKRDGSLLYGLEMVTRPLSLSKMYEFINEFTKTNMQPDNIFKVTASKRCGLHIHVSNPPKIVIFKLLMLINSFSVPLIKRIARRTDSSFAGKSTIEKSNYFTREKTSFTGKYTLLNTNKPDTIEFRLFAGTVDRALLLSDFETVQSLISFCTIHNTTKITPVEYLKWLRINKKKLFPHIQWEITDQSIAHEEEFKNHWIINKKSLTKIKSKQTSNDNYGLPHHEKLINNLIKTINESLQKKSSITVRADHLDEVLSYYTTNSSSSWEAI